MALVNITAVFPVALPINGGVEVVITGVFDITKTYRVYIGPNGDDSDEPCFSSYNTSGNGYVVTPDSATQLTVVGPPLDRGNVHALSVYSVDGLDEGHYGAPLVAVEVMHRDWTHIMRKSWSPWYDTGPRSLTEEPRQDQ